MAYDDVSMPDAAISTFSQKQALSFIQRIALDNPVSYFLNRKKHSGGTYHTWMSDSAPDPLMDYATPPFPKNEYGDHLILKVFRGGL